MDLETARIVTRVFAVLSWIGAGFMLLLGVLLLVFGSVLAKAANDAEPIVKAVLAGVGVGIIVFALLGTWVAWGMWTCKNWARIVCIISGWFGAVCAVAGFALSFIDPDPIAIVLSFFWNIVFSGGISVFYIWFFQFEPTVKELFSGAQPKPVVAPKLIPVLREPLAKTSTTKKKQTR